MMNIVGVKIDICIYYILKNDIKYINQTMIKHICVKEAAQLNVDSFWAGSEQWNDKTIKQEVCFTIPDINYCKQVLFLYLS